MAIKKLKIYNLNNLFLLVFLPIVMLSVISCETTRRANNQNVSYLYKKEAPSFNPEYAVVHINDTLSELHFRISSNQVLYARPSAGMPFSAQIKLSYRIFDDFDAHIILDTATMFLNNVENSDLLNDLVGSTTFKAYQGTEYVVEVTMTDLNRNRQRKTFIKVEKTNQNSRQNFIARNYSTNLPSFNNLAKDTITINYSYPNKNKLYVRYYNREFGIAAPPFAMINPKPFDYLADSLFELPLENQKAILDVKKTGFYHFQVDTIMNRDGYTIFHFDDTYPEIKTIDDMVSPLRYLTSKSEFEEIANAPNKKEAVDRFWLNIAGNPDRARELISIFYNRVQEANLHFSSFIEGWKTDRGMIYIIFGPPNVLYKASETENWIYGEDQNMMSLTFNFIVIENPFTDNDYSLERSVIYKNNWYRAVETWRQGRVF